MDPIISPTYPTLHEMKKSIDLNFDPTLIYVYVISFYDAEFDQTRRQDSCRKENNRTEIIKIPNT